MRHCLTTILLLPSCLLLVTNVSAQELITFRNDLKANIIVSVKAQVRDTPTRSGQLSPGQSFTFQLFSPGQYDLSVEPLDEPGGLYSKPAIDLKTLARNMQNRTVSLKGVFDFDFRVARDKSGNLRYGYTQVREAVTMTVRMNSGDDVMGVLAPKEVPAMPFADLAPAPIALPAAAPAPPGVPAPAPPAPSRISPSQDPPPPPSVEDAPSSVPAPAPAVPRLLRRPNS